MVKISKYLTIRHYLLVDYNNKKQDFFFFNLTKDLIDMFLFDWNHMNFSLCFIMYWHMIHVWQLAAIICHFGNPLVRIKSNAIFFFFISL